jgi:hypothetical protein
VELRQKREDLPFLDQYQSPDRDWEQSKDEYQSFFLGDLSDEPCRLGRRSKAWHLSQTAIMSAFAEPYWPRPKRPNCTGPSLLAELAGLPLIGAKRWLAAGRAELSRR